MMGARFRTICAGLIGVVAVGVLASRYLVAAAGTAELTANTRRLIGRRLGTPQLRRAQDTVAQQVHFTSSRRHALLIFTPECPACRLARPQWEALASELPVGATIDAVSLRPDNSDRDTLRFFSHPSIREWHGNAGTLIRLIPTGVVPITIIVSPGGTIERAEAGVPSRKAIKELRDLLIGTDAR